jgi:phosphoribosylformimino-5-aminoimidazole carboxamide ribotide isomerase
MPSLTLYPAIDLLDGRCVRLLQGDVAGAEVFDDDPVAVARRWREAGAEWLHIVDLHGALAGEPRQ